MYWQDFGFNEPPFALTPNPAFLYLSTPHQEAFAHLLFAIENRVGFIELSGEVGTGKTTLVRTLLNHLDAATHRTALIFNPTLSPLGFLKELNAELGISAQGGEMRDLHQALNGFLLEEHRAGRTVVLVIDEAQNLSVEVLEHIRLISNLETEADKLIQIVLVGQPELNNLLGREELRQLDQRITVRYHLKPMSFEDSRDYIRHRIRFAANGREPLTFSPGALKKIFAYSKGLPRLINGVCDRALLLAYTRETKLVSPSMAALSIADLRRESPSRRPASLAFAASVVVAVLAVAVFFVYPHRAVEAKKPAQATAQGPFSRELALRELATLPEQQNLYSSVNAVLTAWQKEPVQPVPGASVSVRSLARSRGLVATKVTGDLDALARLDAPALLHLSVPGAGSRLLVLSSIGKDGVEITPALAGHTKLTPAELSQLWSGEAILLWKDFHRLSSREKRAEKAEGTRLLQGLLKEAGCYSGQISGLNGPETKAAIAEFQRREKIKVDGEAGGVTLMLLYRRAGGFFPPGINARR
ncbi:AAA family ATPase [Geomonas sp.]|uniref:AAA family ATPase n=1 Tax=Geomonas sp. TaxID=2651584 RepID=UPI002B46A58E|nr:AAA family ATPase [Geomonas sp.]HJV34951.1 AAA family ATPase [Geomonas sp.]